MKQDADLSATELKLSCSDFDDALRFFTATCLGFRVETIFPADDPKVAAIYQTRH